MSKQPHAREREDSAEHGQWRHRVAEVEEGDSDHKYSAHAVGNAVGDGGRCGEEGEGRVVVHEVRCAAEQDAAQCKSKCRRVSAASAAERGEGWRGGGRCERAG